MRLDETLSALEKWVLFSWHVRTIGQFAVSVENFVVELQYIGQAHGYVMLLDHSTGDQEAMKDLK
jgi:hypothetical protein